MLRLQRWEHKPQKPLRKTKTLKKTKQSKTNWWKPSRTTPLPKKKQRYSRDGCLSSTSSKHPSLKCLWFSLFFFCFLDGFHHLFLDSFVFFFFEFFGFSQCFSLADLQDTVSGLSFKNATLTSESEGCKHAMLTLERTG